MGHDCGDIIGTCDTWWEHADGGFSLVGGDTQCNGSDGISGTKGTDWNPWSGEKFASSATHHVSKMPILYTFCILKKMCYFIYSDAH